MHIVLVFYCILFCSFYISSKKWHVQLDAGRGGHKVILAIGRGVVSKPGVFEVENPAEPWRYASVRPCDPTPAMKDVCEKSSF